MFQPERVISMHNSILLASPTNMECQFIDEGKEYGLKHGYANEDLFFAFLMLVLVLFFFVACMLMVVFAMFSYMLMIMSLLLGGMLVFMSVLMGMFVGMHVLMLMGMCFFVMCMFVLVLMFVFM
jgi:hypothetical protein